MPNWKKVTEQDKLDMFEMFENGMSNKEVTELTGWKNATVYEWRKKWKKQKSKSNPQIVEETVIEQEKPADAPISDYAKAYLADDPAVVHSSFDVERVVRIKSKKTSILYEVDGCDQKTMKISFPDGKTLEIEIGLFDKFVDEGIDVLLELRKTA